MTPSPQLSEPTLCESRSTAQAGQVLCLPHCLYSSLNTHASIARAKGLCRVGHLGISCWQSTFRYRLVRGQWLIWPGLIEPRRRLPRLSSQGPLVSLTARQAP